VARRSYGTPTTAAYSDREQPELAEGVVRNPAVRHRARYELRRGIRQDERSRRPRNLHRGDAIAHTAILEQVAT